MLTQYLNVTKRLLQNPASPTALYSDADLTTYINISRGQLAGEAECCRAIATLDTVVGQQEYAFSALTLANTALQGVISISRIMYSVGTGQKWIAPSPWPWFDLYVNNNAVPQQSWPTDWSQYGQGAAPGSTGTAGSGSFWINQPDQAYTLNCDCVCYPIALADNTTIEAIPYLWTDAVPFFAACYALWSAQNNARLADAERYFNTYKMFVERARKASNPSVNRWMYSQAGDPPQAAKMQIGGKAGA